MLREKLVRKAPLNKPKSRFYFIVSCCLILLSYYLYSSEQTYSKFFNSEDSNVKTSEVSNIPSLDRFSLKEMPPPMLMNCSGDNCSFQKYLSKLNQKVVIVNFWASWCKPCLEEMPSLLKLSAKLPQANYQVVLISVDEDKNSAMNFLKSFKFPYNVLSFWDGNQESNQYFQVSKFPETVVIGKNFKIIQKIEGAVDWMRDDMMEYLLSIR